MEIVNCKDCPVAKHTGTQGAIFNQKKIEYYEVNCNQAKYNFDTMRDAKILTCEKSCKVNTKQLSLF